MPVMDGLEAATVMREVEQANGWPRHRIVRFAPHFVFALLADFPCSSRSLSPASRMSKIASRR